MFGWVHLTGRNSCYSNPNRTHSYLLKGTYMPWCYPCHCPDTVKHILLDCTELSDTRIKYYRNVNNLKNLFNEW